MLDAFGGTGAVGYMFKQKKCRKTKSQIIYKLLQERYINEFVYFNLLKSKFTTSEIKEIDKICRENLKKGYRKELDRNYKYWKTLI